MPVSWLAPPRWRGTVRTNLLCSPPAARLDQSDSPQDELCTEAGPMRPAFVHSSGGSGRKRGMEMQSRRLGRSGLKVSVLSFGSWVTFGPQLDDDLAMRCMEAAFDAGVNFFDNAEAYAGGDSERIMGRVIGKLGWRRESFVVSTKFFWGLTEGVNTKNTLN